MTNQEKQIMLDKLLSLSGYLNDHFNFVYKNQKNIKNSSVIMDYLEKARHFVIKNIDMLDPGPPWGTCPTCNMPSILVYRYDSRACINCNTWLEEECCGGECEEGFSPRPATPKEIIE